MTGDPFVPRSGSSSRVFGLALAGLAVPLGLAVLLGLVLRPGAPPDDLQTLLRLRVAALETESAARTVADQRVLAAETVARHYRQTGFAPGWTGPDGPTPVADSLLAALRAADRDGLRPSDYHVATLDSLGRHLRAQADAGASMDPRALADFELLCTDAFLLYGGHLLRGRVDPVELVPTWTLDRRQADLTAHLQRALDAGSVRSVLDGLRPPQPEYAAFRRTLRRYRTIAERDGWPTVPDGPTLTEGARDERVPTLRRRLRATGDLSAERPPDSLRFDAPLRRAVARFQERHGLAIDGTVGPATRAALNVPVAARIDQIVVNMERWRWLPRDLGSPHVRVNIADFWLRVVEQGTPTLQMRVVVGTRYRQTPVFSDRISYLVFSPYWHVPPNIAAQDKLPEFQRDPSLVSRLGFEVLDGWGADARTVDPSTIEWGRLSAANFPYRLRQRPGPANALGQVKFMFPNRHNVYLHDTPARSLFGRPERGFSSGCIRVEHPVGLAAFLLRAHDDWTPERIRTAMNGNTEQTAVLREKVPVHLLYWTAWMEEGTLHFRDDVYQRDDAVAAALAAPPSPPPRSTAAGE